MRGVYGVMNRNEGEDLCKVKETGKSPSPTSIYWFCIHSEYNQSYFKVESKCMSYFDVRVNTSIFQRNTTFSLIIFLLI